MRRLLQRDFAIVDEADFDYFEYRTTNRSEMFFFRGVNTLFNIFVLINLTYKSLFTKTGSK